MTEPVVEVETEWETPSFKKVPLVGSTQAFVLILVSLLLLFALLLTMIVCAVKQWRTKDNPLAQVQPNLPEQSVQINLVDESQTPKRPRKI